MAKENILLLRAGLYIEFVYFILLREFFGPQDTSFFRAGLKGTHIYRTR